MLEAAKQDASIPFLIWFWKPLKAALNPRQRVLFYTAIHAGRYALTTTTVFGDADSMLLESEGVAKFLWGYSSLHFRDRVEFLSL